MSRRLTLGPVEFYLCDSNLPFDKFLFSVWTRSFHAPAKVVLDTPVPADRPASTLHAATASGIAPFHLGWIPFATLVSFKRMTPYLDAAPLGFGSVDAMVTVLQAKSSLVELCAFGTPGAAEAGWYVRRTTDLARPEDPMERSVYIKGFPVSEGVAATDEEKAAEMAFENELQIKLEQWIRTFPVGVKSLRMRRPTGNTAAGKAVKGQGRSKYKVRPAHAFESS